MTTRPKQMQKWSNRNEKTHPTDKNRNLQFSAETNNNKLGREIQQNKSQKSKKRLNKVAVDREQYLLNIIKPKRNQQQQKPRSIDKNATPTIFERNQQQKIRPRDLAKQKSKKWKKHTTNKLWTVKNTYTT